MHKFNTVFLRCLFSLVIFLLPWKLGCLVGNAEQPNFPLTSLEWIYCTGFPAYFAVVLGGILLFFTILIHKQPEKNNWRFWSFEGIFLVTFLASWISLGFSTETDYARQWLIYFCGASSIGIAFAWCATKDDGFLPWQGNALGLTGLLTVLHGWYQHFWGLKENLRLIQEMAANGTLQVQPQLLEKMTQTRIYGCFADPNLFASYLLLVCPFTLWCLYRWGTRFEYPKLGSRLLLAIGSILFAGALFWTGSRGAAVGLAGGSAALLWFLPKVRAWRWRWVLPVGAILLAIGLIGIMCLGKERGGMTTASVRLTYYRAALEMFKWDPLFGVGMGEFFPWYLRLKPIGAEVTRNVHCFPLMLLCQCGFLGGLSALCFYCWPWIIATLAKPAKEYLWLFLASISACIAWLVHSLFQFNEITPGSFYTAIILMGSLVSALFLPKEMHTTAQPAPQPALHKKKQKSAKHPPKGLTAPTTVIAQAQVENEKQPQEEKEESDESQFTNILKGCGCMILNYLLSIFLPLLLPFILLAILFGFFWKYRQYIVSIFSIHLAIIFLFLILSILPPFTRFSGEIALQQAENALHSPTPTRAVDFYIKCNDEIPNAIAPLNSLESIAWQNHQFKQAEQRAMQLVTVAPHRSSFWLRLVRSRAITNGNVTEPLAKAARWYPHDPQLELWRRSIAWAKNHPEWSAQERERWFYETDATKADYVRQPDGAWNWTISKAREGSPVFQLEKFTGK